MSQFDKYFLMKTSDVVDYARQKLDFFSKDADLECSEIGDGNINFIFRVWDRISGKSVVVKQAGPTARISEDFVLSTDRNRIESEILILEHELAPGLVPLIYKFDETMSCCAMEDLSDYVIMRTALMEHKTFPLFADHITTFMANTLLTTTDVVMNHQQKKEMVKRYTNPELCEITEDLVYTEPFNDYKGRNDVFPPNLDWVKENVYNNASLRLEAAKLKFEFLTNTQALIHGDLHTGSIFIKPESTKIIDPEFAFYGPIGYDTGNIVANLIFAWANGDATIADPAERAVFCGWVEETIVQVVDMFNQKFLAVWQANVTEILAKEPGFDRWYLATVMRDTAGVAGLELFRRTLGLAHVKDITSIADQAARIRAERICLSVAERYIKQRGEYQTGADFLNTVKQFAAQFPRS
jgi:5-methylthioribose kinase